MISVIVPALNEEAAISATVTQLKRTLEEAALVPFEVVVVDDGSSDATRRLAEEAGARVISHPHNVGYGKSLKDGITAARYDTIVITDADGTYPVGDIPKLVLEYQRGFDMVVGARMGEHYRESFVKAPLRTLLRSIVEFTAARRIPDINSGLRVFSRATVMRYFTHLCDTFSFTTSMTLAYMMNSRFVHYVAIEYYERQGVTKVRLLRDSVRTMQYIIEAATYFNPLKIFALFAFICLLMAGVSLVAAIVLQLVSLFLLGVGAILLAVLVLALGLLAVLLKQIMDSDREGREAGGTPKLPGALTRATPLPYLVLALKLLVVPAGLAFLAFELARDSRLGTIHVDAALLVAALVVNQLALALFAARMQLVLRVFGMSLAWLQGLRVHLQSMFYFFVLPMTVGLEIARFAKIRSLLGAQAATGNLTYALLADRVVGALAALVLALALLPFMRFESLATWGGSHGWLPWAGAALAVAALALLHPRVRGHAARLLAVLRAEHRRLASSFAVALATHACFALAIYLAATGAGIPIGPMQALFAVSAAMLFVVVPVSFAGVSPVEAANFGVLAAMGLTLEHAALFAFIVYAAKLVAAVEGAAWEIAEGGGQLSRMLMPGQR